MASKRTTTLTVKIFTTEASKSGLVMCIFYIQSVGEGHNAASVQNHQSSLINCCSPKITLRKLFCLHFRPLIHICKDLHCSFIYSSGQSANMINVFSSSYQCLTLGGGGGGALQLMHQHGLVMSLVQLL